MKDELKDELNNLKDTLTFLFDKVGAAAKAAADQSQAIDVLAGKKSTKYKTNDFGQYIPKKDGGFEEENVRVHGMGGILLNAMIKGTKIPDKLPGLDDETRLALKIYFAMLALILAALATAIRLSLALGKDGMVVMKKVYKDLLDLDEELQREYLIKQRTEKEAEMVKENNESYEVTGEQSDDLEEDDEIDPMLQDSELI